MDIFEAIVIGAAAAAIGTIVATKFLTSRGGPPYGGARPIYGNAPGQPQHVDQGSGLPQGAVQVVAPTLLGPTSPPVQQNAPITEAAYNQYGTTYEPAFNTNAGEQETLLPQ